ncbi:MAG: hypothetical protein LBC70_09860 [Chitinispirillales bacterium]|nr:hypothetical protein [Chitinispirillales bacterium]
MSKDKYLLINTNHRKNFDDFMINSSDYGFLGDIDRFVSCFKTYNFNSDRIIKKVGNINYNDMMKIIDKIQKSKSINQAEKEVVIPELDKWRFDNS